MYFYSILTGAPNYKDNLPVKQKLMNCENNFTLYMGIRDINFRMKQMTDVRLPSIRKYPLQIYVFSVLVFLPPFPLLLIPLFLYMCSFSSFCFSTVITDLFIYFVRIIC